jgi:hypothetical protein
MRPTVKHGTLSGSHPIVPFTQGKPGKQVMLPSRTAVHKLLKGAPRDRNLLSFSELTPTGRSAPQTYAGIKALGELNKLKE